MKLASLKTKAKTSREGQLVVISQDGKRAIHASSVCPTLLEAVANWKMVRPGLEELSKKLNAGQCQDAFTVGLPDFAAPITNAPGFYDGSAFLSHVYRARKARGDVMPESAKKTPLMYQGVSDNQLGPTSPLELMDPAYGGDFEGELAVVLGDVPKGVSAEKASDYILLFTVFNDITYRELVKVELETKFGFLQSKPNSSFAPFAVTPDEFSSAWDGKRLNVRMDVELNGKPFGHPSSDEMHFSFGELIAHAARTRPLSAGTILGTGTISNEDASRGFACLTEKRFMEVIEGGKPTTPWLKAGDRVRIRAMLGNQSPFGDIEQTVV